MPSGGLANASAGYDAVDSILASLAKEVHKNVSLESLRLLPLQSNPKQRKYEIAKEAEVQRLTDMLAKSEEACREVTNSLLSFTVSC